MDEEFDSEPFRASLEAELSALSDEDAMGADDRATVTLDQQSVGRLSRMDAMQRQAMAAARSRRRDERRQRISAALKRLETGEFGWCAECGERIAQKRLQFDPTVPTCIGCASR